ncbi:hypothetical protein TNCT_431521 [Trichonephila clavata]|uniref:Uncharacterized protein n=1 Tax=Trichonephila clavata TaxID=2740835 RepID=A0A8X6GPS7_TRICU|nr:hypothetical protein TNCT_431521 [Trichonephila clavata]
MKQRGVIRFLAAGGFGGREMHRRMKACKVSAVCVVQVLENGFLVGRKFLQNDVSPDRTIVSSHRKLLRK